MEVLQQSRMLLINKERCAAAETIIHNGEPFDFNNSISLCAGFIDGHTSACDVSVGNVQGKCGESAKKV